MTTGIESIAAKAQQEKELKFMSLAHHINSELLWESLNTISPQTAMGVDGQDLRTAKETFSQWSKEMIDAVNRQGYKPPPVRRVYIPKPGKQEKRPIGVPTIQDRVLQIATSKVLNGIFEQDFLDSSFGGRPNRSAHQALASLYTSIVTKKVSFILEADLKNFFGSLNHGWVRSFFEHRVGDPRILSLVKRWLKAGVLEDNEWRNTTEETPQGGPISVLTSNVYLHYVLDLWIEKIVKPRMRGDVYYFRYLDDFVLGFQYRSDAIRFQKALAKRLDKFSLKLEPNKTKLVEFGRFASLRDKSTLNRKFHFSLSPIKDCGE